MTDHVVASRSDRTVLCIARQRAGRRFIEETLRLGGRVFVLTEDAEQHAAWPAGISGVITVWSMADRQGVLHVARELATRERVDRVVALLERDVEVAATLREELRIPGQPSWQANLFRDKLAMRLKALSCDVRVPYFAPASDRAAVGRMFEQVDPPYLLKIRDGLGAANITRLDDRDSAWRAIDGLGSETEHYIVEQYVKGDVFHVDSLTQDGQPRFAIASRYGLPLLDVVKGGNFVSFTLDQETELARRLLEANRRIITGFGFEQGPTHIEFILGAHDQEVYFLEGASRLAAARIPWVIEEATGVCLHHEWARLEVLDAYTVSPGQRGFAGIVTTVARHGPADLSGFQDPHIVWRSPDPFVPGLILRADDPHVLEARIRAYDRQFSTL
ncbi:MAG TPA: hypothetical protein V6D05_08975 [Stenomitos sp.]